MSDTEFSTLAWATPVRPLVGRARHAVWAGETPVEQIRAGSWAYWRQRSRTASVAVACMREDVATGTVRFPGHSADANPTHSAHGEDRVRWIEDPEAFGLRLVGLAHEFGRSRYAYTYPAVDHPGWYLHPDGIPGEVVSGVVYRMSGKTGCARYLVGYADPWNCDETGRGPALLCLDPILGDRVGADWEFDPVLRDAARRADRIAEVMAEEERDYQGAYEAGRAARQAGRAMRETAARYVGALRACRTVFRNRHRISVTEARLVLKALAGQARGLLADLRSARRAFRDGLETGPGWESGDTHGWRNGYVDG